MPGFPQFSFDRISFWLGFIAASLFWLFFLRLKIWFPRIAAAYLEFRATLKRNKLLDVYANISKATLNFAQNQHLAHELFPLGQILIEPRLLAQPTLSDHTETQIGESVIQEILPYTPDWPELASPYPVPTISLAEALLTSNKIAVMGPPGIGKTTALTHLASIIARQVRIPELLNETIPVLIHISELNIPGDQDPLKNIIQAVSPRISILLQPRLTEAIQQAITRKKLVLILDGIDEVYSDQLSNIRSFIESLLKSYPDINIVITISPEHKGSFTKLGFMVYGIHAWNSETRNEFTQKWKTAWETLVLSSLKKSQYETIDQNLIQNWLFRPGHYFSPFDWTLITWAAFSGDIKGPASLHALQSFISRAADENLMPILEKLSQEFFENHLSYNKISQALIIKPSNQEDNKNKENLKKSGGVEDVIKAGLVIQNPNGTVRFAHPILFGYILGISTDVDFWNDKASDINWCITATALRFLCSKGTIPDWIQVVVSTDHSPHFRDTLIISRWIPEIPVSHTFRTGLLKRLVSLVVSNQIPFSLRLRFMSSILVANDQSTYRLVKQLASMPDTFVKKIAAFGFAFLYDDHLLDDLSSLVDDSDPEVQKIACLAFAAIPGDQAQKVCIDMISSMDETIRRIIAEALSAGNSERQELLRDLSQNEDLLVRRAVVYALTHLRESWSKEILEKLAIQDSQWVVRNSAVEALDVWKNKTTPQKLTKPAISEASWLISFAGRRGEVLAKNQFPFDMLFKAVQEGTISEKILAIEYLQDEPTPETLNLFKSCLVDPQSKVQEAALQGIWNISLKSPNLN